MEQRRKRTIDEKSNHIKNRQRREQYVREQQMIEHELYQYGRGPYGELGYYDDTIED